MRRSQRFRKPVALAAALTLLAVPWTASGREALASSVPDDPPELIDTSQTGSQSSSQHVLPLTVNWNVADIALTTVANSHQSENSVFVNPISPLEVLVSNNSHTQYPVVASLGADYWFSTDAGLTWSGSILGVGGPNWGDPAAVIGPLNNRFFVGCLTTTSLQQVAYSDNAGQNWSAVPLPLGGAGGLTDKNHLWVDHNPASPCYNNLYSAWLRWGGTTENADEIELVRSTDNGATWSDPPIGISNSITSAEWNQGVNIQTGPNGEVYVAWAVYYDASPGNLLESSIGFARSLNGGLSFPLVQEIPIDILGHRNRDLGGGKNMRHNSYPSMAVNQQTGEIYVVWTNLGVPGINNMDDGPDIYISSSTDLGVNWSAPVRVNQDNPTYDPLLHRDQYFPWLTCDPVTGILACIFYDSRNFVNNDSVETFVALSRDRRKSWIDVLVSDVSWPGDGLWYAENLPYAGDYIGIAARSGHVYPVWTDTRDNRLLSYVSPIEIGRKLLVPSVYPTIQAAINAANPWDTVLVTPDTYISMAGFYDVDLAGKDVAVIGAVGSNQTVLQLPGDGGHSAFILTSGEGHFAVVKGFTIQLADNGAIRTSGSPRIENCVFKNCRGTGAAVRVEAPFGIVAAPTITGCVFEDGVGGDGPGIYLSTFTEARIGNCTFRRNHAFPSGGAIYSAPDPVHRDSMYNCVFYENSSDATYGSGGALYLGGNAYLKSNTFVANECSGTSPAVIALGAGVTGVDIDLQIMAFNPTVGVRCEPGAAGIAFECNLFWQNSGGNFGLCQDPNALLHDPMFCDLAQGEFALHWNSPCVDANNPPECPSTIGALGVDYACGPPIPLLLPPNGSTTTSHSPTLTWTAVAESGAEIEYEVQVDNNSDLLSPERSVTGLVEASWNVDPILSDGLYYWRVRYVAHLPGGGSVIGDWSTTWSFTSQCLVLLTGDVNVDGQRTASDIVTLINYVNGGGPAPLPCTAAGDVNWGNFQESCSLTTGAGTVTSGDIIYLVNFVFKAMDPPCDVCLLIDQGVHWQDCQ